MIDCFDLFANAFTLCCCLQFDKPVESTMKNRMAFANSILKKGKGTITPVGARNLQYLCITVLFRFVSFAFMQHYKTLTDTVMGDVKEYEETMNKLSPWPAVLPHYHRILYDILGPDRNNVFQEKFGHVLYVKILVWVSKKAPAWAAESFEKTPSKKRKGQHLEPIELGSMEQRIDIVEQRCSIIEALEERLARLELRDEQMAKQITQLEMELKVMQATYPKDDAQVQKPITAKNPSFQKAGQTDSKSVPFRRVNRMLLAVDNASSVAKSGDVDVSTNWTKSERLVISADDDMFIESNNDVDSCLNTKVIIAQGPPRVEQGSNLMTVFGRSKNIPSDPRVGGKKKTDPSDPRVDHSTIRATPLGKLKNDQDDSDNSDAYDEELSDDDRESVK